MMRIIVCKLMFHFDFELCTDFKSWMGKNRAWATWTVPELMIKSIPRKAAYTQTGQPAC